MAILGIISDTHGSLSSAALDALSDVDHILHAGDIGSFQVLESLLQIAPTSAVRGNTDGGDWCLDFPVSDIIEVFDVTFFLLHDLQKLDLDPVAAGIQIVIHGHTHQPESLHQEGVLYFNPGSASFRRHGGPLSVGRIEIVKNTIVPKIITIDS